VAYRQSEESLRIGTGKTVSNKSWEPRAKLQKGRGMSRKQSSQEKIVEKRIEFGGRKENNALRVSSPIGVRKGGLERSTFRGTFCCGVVPEAVESSFGWEKGPKGLKSLRSARPRQEVTERNGNIKRRSPDRRMSKKFRKKTSCKVGELSSTKISRPGPVRGRQQNAHTNRGQYEGGYSASPLNRAYPKV